MAPLHANGYLFAASGYNVFIQNTFTLGGATTQGAVAAGGNVFASNGTSFASLAGVYAPGTYALVTAGIFQPSGSGSVNGNLWEASKGTTDPSYTVLGSTTIGGIDPVDFGNAFSQLDKLSTTLAGYSNTAFAGNGCVNFYNNINCTGNASGLNVINIPYSATKSSNNGTVTSADLGGRNLTFNIGSSATAVVINIVGDTSTHSVQLGGGGGFTVNGDGSKLLFNYASANGLVIGGSVYSSLLAPYSAVTTQGGGSQIDGTFIAGSYSGSSLAFNIQNNGSSGLFTGVLPQAPIDTPEPATFGLIGGALLILGALRRAPR